jgi:hypothetical protein
MITCGHRLQLRRIEHTRKSAERSKVVNHVTISRIRGRAQNIGNRVFAKVLQPNRRQHLS